MAQLKNPEQCDPVSSTSPVDSARDGKSTNARHPDDDSEEVGVICDSLVSARRLMIPMASVSLLILALLAICYSLYFCKAIMLPITGAFLLNFLFSPIVGRARRLGVPNAVSTLIILAVAASVLVLAAMFAYEPAKTWLSNKDENLAIVESRLLSLRQPLEAIQDVSDQIDQLTSGDSVSATKSEESKEKQDSKLAEAGSLILESFVDMKKEPPKTEKQTRIEIVPVEVRQPGISRRIFTSTGDAMVGFFMMLVLLFYLLAAGDRGLEKLVEFMPTFRNKRRIVELTRAIEKSVSSYLLTTTIINAGLGFFIGLGMWAIGMPNPILWGVMAMLLNYFPFIGAIAGTIVVFFVAVISFDSIVFAAMAPAIYLVANLIEANFITPVLLGRSVSLHPVWLMIFFVVVSWVWGLGGAIIAVPVLAVIKISCDHIEPLMPIGKFLGQ